VARLECSLQPGEAGMRQEVDIRYVATSLKGSAQHLYENIYCQRGQMENLIKLHKAQLASDRMSCHSATANQVRLVLHTAPRTRAQPDARAGRVFSHRDRNRSLPRTVSTAMPHAIRITAVMPEVRSRS
jgi:hypothetical protein